MVTCFSHLPHSERLLCAKVGQKLAEHIVREVLFQREQVDELWVPQISRQHPEVWHDMLAAQVPAEPPVSTGQRSMIP
eukprot:1598131-Rhodomonas_salina.7